MATVQEENKKRKKQFFKTITKHWAIEKRPLARVLENSVHVAFFILCLFLTHRIDDTCFSWCFMIRGICFVLGITKHLDVFANYELLCSRIYLFWERSSWGLRWPWTPYTLEGDLELTFLSLPPIGRFISLKEEEVGCVNKGVLASSRHLLNAETNFTVIGVPDFLFLNIHDYCRRGSSELGPLQPQGRIAYRIAPAPHTARCRGSD